MTINTEYKQLVDEALNPAPGKKPTPIHLLFKMQRLAMGLTQMHASALMGVNQAYISQLEQGRQKWPDHRADQWREIYDKWERGGLTATAPALAATPDDFTEVHQAQAAKYHLDGHQIADRMQIPYGRYKIHRLGFVPWPQEAKDNWKHWHDAITARDLKVKNEVAACNPTK